MAGNAGDQDALRMIHLAISTVSPIERESLSTISLNNPYQQSLLQC